MSDYSLGCYSCCQKVCVCGGGGDCGSHEGNSPTVHLAENPQLWKVQYSFKLVVCQCQIVVSGATPTARKCVCGVGGGGYGVELGGGTGCGWGAGGGCATADRTKEVA